MKISVYIPLIVCSLLIGCASKEKRQQREVTSVEEAESTSAQHIEIGVAANLAFFDIGTSESGPVVWQKIKGTLAREGEVLDLYEQAIAVCLHYDMIGKARYLLRRMNKIAAALKSEHRYLNILGITEYHLGNQEGAELAWTGSLEQKENFEPAALNLSRLFIRNGYFEQGLQILNELDESPIQQRLLVVVFRHLALNDETDRLCEVIQTGKPDFIAYYNCALHEFQNNRKPDKAIALLEEIENVTNLTDEQSENVQERMAEFSSVEQP